MSMSEVAVLFDLDGTLLDTIGDLADSMNAALAALGHPTHPEEAYLRFVGDGVAELARRALPPARRDETSVRACIAAMKAEYAQRWDVRTHPYEGVPELLDALGARGIPVADLRNKMEDVTRVAVDHWFGLDRFAEVRGAREGVPRKPDPEAALAIAARLGVAPERVLYLGDTDTDMRTAVAAGMVPFGVLWGFRDEAELRENGARHLLRRPGELLAYVRNTTDA